MRMYLRLGLLVAAVALSFLNSGETAATSCTPVPSGLVSWWPGDGDAADIIGGHDGALENGAAFAPGKVGQAFLFDGVDDFVSVPDDPIWTLGDDPFTIDLWVNFDQIKGRDPFVSHDESANNYNKWVFWFDVLGHNTPPGPALRFMVNIPDDPVWPGHDPVIYPWEPNAGQWYHAAVTRTGDTYALYIDGAQVATGTDPLTIPDADAALMIGRAEQYWFDGRIDEVEIYSRALTASEIEAIYNAGAAGKCKSPAVGGIAELPQVSDSSGPNYVALAGLAAAALLALTAGAWYARRRWVG